MKQFLATPYYRALPSKPRRIERLIRQVVKKSSGITACRILFCCAHNRFRANCGLIFYHNSEDAQRVFSGALSPDG